MKEVFQKIDIYFLYFRQLTMVERERREDLSAADCVPGRRRLEKGMIHLCSRSLLWDSVPCVLGQYIAFLI